MRHVLRLVRWLVILVLVLGLAFSVYLLVKIGEPLKTQAEPQNFTVAPGETTREIAKNLEAQKLISRALFFELYVYVRGASAKIQAGNYLLSSEMPIREIARTLIAGEVLPNQFKFTVIEGWTLTDIAGALEQPGIIKKQDFLAAAKKDYAAEFEFLRDKPKGASLEGYLFPDTYLLAKDGKPEDAVLKMLSNFDRKLNNDLRKTIKEQGKTIYETVTLASIIEKEVGRNLQKGTKLTAAEQEKLREERRLVASVFANRLRIGKALESDATIAYVTGSKSNRATLEELKINSPYNTYKYRGLPPGPISNPSLDALNAAINPAKTDYFYFVTAPDGTAYFAKTLEEHIRNRERYLK